MVFRVYVEKKDGFDVSASQLAQELRNILGIKNLKSATIGANVESIGVNAFNGDKKLKTITIKTTSLTKSSVKSNAFKGIYKKATVKCPSKKKKEYQKFLVKKGVPKTAKFK